MASTPKSKPVELSPVAIPEELPALLVVDDDPDILRIVQFFLSKQNYTVHAATDGDDALAILHEHPEIELILSDVMMPRVSGLDLLKQIRASKQFAEIPVILISAEGETSRKVAGLNLGADDYITKPFNFDELIARVRNHLRLRRLQRDLVDANALLTRQYAMLVESLETARGVQRALMPDEFPESTAYRLGSRYLPVDRLGGDFFDVVFLNGGRKVGVLIADVCGHGVGAAFITAMTKITFRNACFHTFDPAEVLEQMNRELCSSLSDGYVTAFYAILDLDEHALVYASGGHPPLLVHRHADGKVIELDAQSTFLGIFDSVTFTSESLPVAPGDRIVFYTDGLVESHDGKQEQFGRPRLIKYLRDHKKVAIQSLLDGLVDELHAFTHGGDIGDDVTLVGLEVLR